MKTNANANPSFFASSKDERDERCAAKDAIVERVIAGLKIPNPEIYRAILMPNAYGPEIELLQKRGVRTSGMFAIERDPEIRLRQAERGMKVPYKALPVEKAIDCVPFEKVDFCYLDFFGQPGPKQLEAFTKIFRLGLLKPQACLLVTFGVNRGDSFSCHLNKSLTMCPGEAYLRAAIDQARHVHPLRTSCHPYSSSTGVHSARFITTEMQF